MKFKIISPLQVITNQRGDVLIAAIIVMIISLASSGVMLYNAQSIKEVSKRPRIRSQMLSVESKVRSALISPLSYVGCTAGDATGGKTTCTLNTGLLMSFQRILPEAHCPKAKPSCGISLTVSPLQMIAGGNTARAQVKIAYEGEEVSINDIDVVMDIPGDILQQTGVFRCPASKPVFLGLLPNGQLNCQALPPLVGPGEFANEINLTEMKIVKSVLPDAFTCPAGKIIGNFKWMDGGNQYPDPATVCVDRPSAFSVFGFEPRPSGATGDVTYVPNPDYP